MSLDEQRHEVEDNGKTIRPSRSPSGPTEVPLPPIATVEAELAVEDWSDLAAGEDDQKLEDKVAGFKVRTCILRLSMCAQNPPLGADKKFIPSRALSSRRH